MIELYLLDFTWVRSLPYYPNRYEMNQNQWTACRQRQVFCCSSPRTRTATVSRLTTWKERAAISPRSDTRFFVRDSGARPAAVGGRQWSWYSCGDDLTEPSVPCRVHRVGVVELLLRTPGRRRDARRFNWTEASWHWQPRRRRGRAARARTRLARCVRHAETTRPARRLERKDHLSPVAEYIVKKKF
jgi:hypothetical protein